VKVGIGVVVGVGRKRRVDGNPIRVEVQLYPNPNPTPTGKEQGRETPINSGLIIGLENLTETNLQRIEVQLKEIFKFPVQRPIILGE
jgi:hypothetical protein